LIVQYKITHNKEPTTRPYPADYAEDNLQYDRSASTLPYDINRLP